MSEPDIREVEPGVYSIIHEGKSFVVRVTAPAVKVEDPRDAAPQVNSKLGGGRQNLIASMPGKVVRVLVSVDQQVDAGQGLVVIEAMKMQNEMRAAKPGKVTKINVQDGGTVAAGDVLLILE
jgi:biotin carboxyl carrier protein